MNKLDDLVTDKNPYYVGIQDGRKAILKELKDLLEKDIPIKDKVKQQFKNIIKEEQNEKIQKIVKLWCRWNAKTLDGGKAMFKIGYILETETRDRWPDFVDEITKKEGAPRDEL